MSVPSLCPKTGSGSCIGDRCPVYVMDWRSKDEYCNVGYYPEHERTPLGEPVVDNYAARIKSNKSQTSVNSKRLNLDSILNGLQESDEPAPAVENKSSKPKNKVQKASHLMDMDDISDDYEAQFWA